MDAPIKTQIHNLVILDKSGSMESIRTQAINGYNETLGSIRATQLKFIDTQEHFVSLAAFCNCGIDMIHDMTPIKDAENLTRENYNPCCCTPLFDAIGISVKALQNKLAGNPNTAVIVTIITDGQENASREWNAKTVNKLIEDCKEEGWTFSFIGAGADVLKVATTISITNTMLWENTPEGTEQMFKRENKARMKYCKMFDAGIMYRTCVAEQRTFKKQLSEEYYKEDEA